MNECLINVSCHKRPITNLRYNRDGDLIFTSSKDSTSTVIRTDGTPLGVYKGHEGSIFTFSINNSTTKLVTGSADQHTIVWDVETGAILHKNLIGSVVKASDNFDNENLFIACCDDSMGRSKCVHSIDCRIKTTHMVTELKHNPTSILIDQSQNNFIYGDDEGILYKYDMRANSIVMTKAPHTCKITSLKPSLCRTFMVSASVDAQSKIIDNENFDCIKTFVCEEPINCADICNTNDKVICVGGINARDVTTTRGKPGFDTSFFDVVTTERVGYFVTHYGTINCVDICNDGQSYCSAGEEGVVSIVHLKDILEDVGFTKL